MKGKNGFIVIWLTAKIIKTRDGTCRERKKRSYWVRTDELLLMKSQLNISWTDTYFPRKLKIFFSKTNSKRMLIDHPSITKKTLSNPLKVTGSVKVDFLHQKSDR